MKVNEHFLDGRSRLARPFGVVENEPKVDRAANLGLWAESMWLPAVFVTDPRVRWEEIDDTHARLIVPFGEEQDEFEVVFDPKSNLMLSMHALRYKEATDEAMTPWQTEVLDWAEIDGEFLPATGSAFWLDERTPWAVFHVEEIVLNADVRNYVTATGP